MITVENIKKARKVIQPHIHKTPIIYSNSFSKFINGEVFLKAENLQKTGSFKVRGAFNRLSKFTSKKVIAASMGNHAQAIAYAAGCLDLEAKIVMPRTAPIAKQEATKGYGAEVVLVGDNFQDAMEYALSQKDFVFVSPFDDDDIIAGQGTIGLEITEELEAIDYVLIPVGGGGLISGIATAVKSFSPKTKIIGVQAKAATSAYHSFRKNKISRRPPRPTIADGVAIGRISDRTFEIIAKYVDDILLVDEDAIAQAVVLFLERKKLVVEGAGSIPLAAMLKAKKKFQGKRVVLIVSGGNIDMNLVDRIIHKGMITSGKIGTFRVMVDDMPGSLHVLTGAIADHGANILNVTTDRLSEKLPIGKAKLFITLETRGKRHLRDIFADLSKKGFVIEVDQV